MILCSTCMEFHLTCIVLHVTNFAWCMYMAVCVICSYLYVFWIHKIFIRNFVRVDDLMVYHDIAECVFSVCCDGTQCYY